MKIHLGLRKKGTFCSNRHSTIVKTPQITMSSHEYITKINLRRMLVPSKKIN